MARFRWAAYPVALATPGQVDQWRDLADVVHECYSIDLLICSVSDDQTRNLGLVTSGNSDVTVAYPGKPKFGATAKVRLTVDGAVVEAREVARPVLHAVHDGEVDLHVGSNVPVRTTQTTTGGTTRAVGATLSYISIGIEVKLKPSRVSATQVRLTGVVSVSDQTSTSDGAPVTSERRVSIDQLLTLGQFGAVARLDRLSETSSGAWFGFGGLRHAGSETFVVLACPKQVSKGRGQSWAGVSSTGSLAVQSEVTIRKTTSAEVSTRSNATESVNSLLPTAKSRSADPVSVPVAPSVPVSPTPQTSAVGVGVEPVQVVAPAAMPGSSPGAAVPHRVGLPVDPRTVPNSPM